MNIEIPNEKVAFAPLSASDEMLDGHRLVHTDEDAGSVEDEEHDDCDNEDD